MRRLHGHGLCQEGLEGVPNIFFLLNLHGLKIRFLDLGKKLIMLLP